MRNLKRALSLTLASVMLLGMMVVGSSAAAGYDDVKETDNVEAIEVLQAVEVMVGDECGFGPDRPVTRAEMAVVMGKLLNLDYNYYVSTCPFADVSGNYDWAKGWVGAAYANKILSGRSADVFDPGAYVTAVEAASMMMRALGYFKYTEDIADGFQLATVRQGNQIGIFNGVGTDATTPMTRNQVAQMALNALRSEIVDFTGTPGIEVNGVKVGYRAQYDPRTGTESKYNAIAGLTTTLGKDESRYYVQLGEELYDGDLKLYDNRNDDFGRPARYWEYNGKDIGTYAKYELLREEYTEAVDGRDLYDLLGKFVIENNDLEYWWNGKLDTTIEAKTMVKANTKDYASTGNGVLTQVFFEHGAKNTDGQITIVTVDTFLAKATGDYNEKKENLNVSIYANNTTANFGADNEIKLDEVASIEGVKKDDKFLVQVAWDGKSYQIVNKLDVDSQIDVKLNKYADDDYLANADGQYDYAKSGKLVKTLGTPNAYYSLNEIADYNNKALVDFTYDLYFDQYGYLIGNAVHSGEKHYVFIAGYDLDGSHLATAYATASAIFLDGTMQNIQVAVSDTNDNIDAYNTKSKAAGTQKYWYPELGKNQNTTADGMSQYNAWFTYTTDTKNGATVYTLTPAENWMDVEATSSVQKIRTSNMVLKETVGGLKGNTAATSGTAGTRAYGNDDSVYITVDTGEVSKGTGLKGITKVTGTYTGVQNVDLNVWKNGTNDGENKLNAKDATTHSSTGTATDWGWNSNAKISGVFAVYDDDLYIIGAIVVGEDDTNSNDYAYVLKKVKNEYIDNDNNHYWDFDAVVDGEIKTLTAKVSSAKYTSMSSVFNDLCGTVGSNGLAQITYDKDGYVTNLAQMQDKVTATANNVAKVYGNMDYTTDINPDTQKVYSVQYKSGGTSAETGCDKEPTTGEFVQLSRSLYNKTVSEMANTYDAGLPLASGAPVIVVRQEKYTDDNTTKIVYEDYNTIEQALSAIDEHNGTFEGWVSAVLDDKGAAKFIVINDADDYIITNNDGPSGGNGKALEVGINANDANKAKVINATLAALGNGAYQIEFADNGKDAAAPNASAQKNIRYIPFTASKDDVGKVTLTIMKKGVGLVYGEDATIADAKVGPNYFFIDVGDSTTGATNPGGYGSMAGASNAGTALTKGTYTFKVVGGTGTLAEGEFEIG